MSDDRHYSTRTIFNPTGFESGWPVWSRAFSVTSVLPSSHAEGTAPRPRRAQSPRRSWRCRSGRTSPSNLSV